MAIAIPGKERVKTALCLEVMGFNKELDLHILPVTQRYLTMELKSSKLLSLQDKLTGVRYVLLRFIFHISEEASVGHQWT